MFSNATAALPPARTNRCSVPPRVQAARPRAATEVNTEATLERAANDLIRAANEAGVQAAGVRLVGAANDVAVIAPAVGEAIGHADHWFQVSPFGRFPHRVGMQVFDRQAANAIVDLFHSMRDQLARLWRGLPIFIGHPDLDPKTYPDHRKYGSIQRLEVRDDGLYAQARWRPRGTRNRQRRTFRFPEPALEHGTGPARGRCLSPGGADLRRAHQPTPTLPVNPWEPTRNLPSPQTSIP